MGGGEQEKISLISSWILLVNGQKIEIHDSFRPFFRFVCLFAFLFFVNRIQLILKASSMYRYIRERSLVLPEVNLLCLHRTGFKNFQHLKPEKTELTVIMACKVPMVRSFLVAFCVQYP